MEEVMSIKTVVKSVSSLFDAKKNVQRANDVGDSAASFVPAAEAANAPIEVVTPGEKSVGPTFALSALRRSGSKASAAVVAASPAVAVPVPVAPAPAMPTAPVIATVPEPTEILAMKTETPVTAAEVPVAENYLAAMILKIARMPAAEIEKIVQQLEKSTAMMPAPVAAVSATTQPIETESGLYEGEIPGTRRTIYVEPRYLVPVDPASGQDVLTPQEIEEKLNRDMEAAVSDTSRRHVNPNAAISHSNPTGRDSWTRR
jgi:hypothetical protein